MNQATMDAMDAVSGSLAECFITVDKDRYNFMQIVEFESKYEINIGEVPILGRTSKGHKPSGAKGTFKGKAHYNHSVIRRAFYQYQKTGVMPRFEIQVTNEDPSSRVGRQTVVHKGCLLEGGTLAKIAAGEDFLDEEISGTFDSWEMPEAFKLPNGMKG